MEIEIKKAIIHVLDKESSEPLLNDYEIELTEDITVFLGKHIIRSLGDDDSRKGIFKEGRNIIMEVCRRIYEEPVYFVEGSKEIARQLFKAMKTNSSISSTDLVVCHYSSSEGEEMVAILKMDYTVSFIHDIEVIDDKYKISIKKQDVSLPGLGQRIQKCVFINCLSHYSDYHMVILDNQINSKNEEPVAQFFLQTFLGGELVLDSKACTKMFKKETENWIREKTKEGEAFPEQIRDIVNDVIRSEEDINLEEFSTKVFQNKLDLREDYISSIKEKGLTTESFQVDREWVEKKLCKIRLKTDSNIEIVMDYSLFCDRDKFEIFNNPDGTKSIIIKSINSLLEK